MIKDKLSIANLRSKISNDTRGFTLIELAIVMVIIGIILGAVLKGQDLINNARAKKFVTATMAYDSVAWSYLDRKGRLPGDSDRDGLISESVILDLTGASFISPPFINDTTTNGNTIQLGGTVFYVYLGYDIANLKNILTICADTGCGSITNDSLMYLEAFDVSVDGLSDGTDGLVRYSDAAPDTITQNSWLATFADGTANEAAWTSGAAGALVYYFDQAAP